MKVTVIGSHLCPDTLYALQQLAAAGAEIDFKDILSCHADLKAYLNLRDKLDPVCTDPRYRTSWNSMLRKRRRNYYFKSGRGFKVIKEIFI